MITNADLKKKVTKQTKIYDGRTGLVAVLLPSGNVTFYVKFYDSAAKKQISIKLGMFNPTTFTLDMARAEAMTHTSAAKRGGEAGAIPVKAVTTINGTVMLRTAFERYITYCQTKVLKNGRMVARKEGWTDIKSALLPMVRRYGSKLLTEITAAHVQDVFNAQTEAGHPAIANMTRSKFGVMLRWCAQPKQGWISGALVTDDASLPPYNPRGKGTRVLSYDEIKTLWHGLRNDALVTDKVAATLKLILSTMQRPGECVSVQRGCIDLRACSMTTPAHRFKSRDRDAVSPLNSLAWEILDKEMRATNYENLMHPPGIDKAMIEKSLAIAMRGRKRPFRRGLCDALGIKRFTPHDLRRTASSLVEATGLYSADQIDIAQQHKLTGVRSHYQGIKEENLWQLRCEIAATLDVALRLIIGLPIPTHLKELAGVVRLKLFKPKSKSLIIPMRAAA